MDIMLDLETWGTTPGCDIRSIGACVFAPDGRHGPLVHDGSLGTIRPFYIATDNPTPLPGDPLHDECKSFYDEGVEEYRKYPLTRDERTIQWWSEQSDEAQAAFADPVDLKDALMRLTAWLDQFTDIRLWSHGAAFDPPILAAAYAAVGLPVPWHYRAPRDTRTLFDAAGIKDHSDWLAQHGGTDRVQHHALSDAICQARAVCAAWKRLRIDAPAPGW